MRLKVYMEPGEAGRAGAVGTGWVGFPARDRKDSELIEVQFDGLWHHRSRGHSELAIG